METIGLVVAVLLVFVLGGWVLYLKKQIADLTDQVAVLEAEREKRSGGSRAKPTDSAETRKSGIQMFEIE